jgi:hypothetical protein
MCSAGRRLWLVALPLVALGACEKGARVFGPLNPIAVGAYQALVFGDSCATDELCTYQPLTEVQEYRSDDPTVADIVLPQDHPRADLALHPFYVLGKKPGDTALVFKGMFADGTIREASIAIHIEAPDSLALDAAGCYSGPQSRMLLASVGSTESFSIEVRAGKDLLAGWLPDAVTADGVTDTFDDRDGNTYTWQAPATPVVLPLQSSIVSTVDGSLRAFGPEQVNRIDFGAEDHVAQPFREPGLLQVQTTAYVDGEAPCHQLPVEMHSSTAAICSGPNGATVWPGDQLPEADVTALTEGSCVLGVSMPGGPILNTETLSIYFVGPAPAGIATPDLGVSCATEGATACGTNYVDVLTCKGGVWVYTSTCPGVEACDFVADATPGCLAGAPCAQCRGLR